MRQVLNGKYNGHSMVGTLQRVLVCSPRTAGWDKPTIAAQWSELGFLHPPDFSTEQAQHEKLCAILSSAGAELLPLPVSPSLTLDAVYTHDASLPTDIGLILMRPGKASRLPEAETQAEFCAGMG